MTRRQEQIIYLGLGCILAGAILLADHFRTGIFFLALGATLVGLNLKPGTGQ